jgi:predicted metal-dependent hydrolase
MMKIDQIIHTKRRTIALIIDRDGRLIIRAPLRATQKQITHLVEQKAAWIKSKQALVNTRYARFVPKAYANGEEFLYLGQAYRLAIVDKSTPRLRLAEQFLLSRKGLPQAEKIFEQWYRLQAKQVITERVQVLAAMHGYEYCQVKITSAQTRWGSCSPRGNLNFSWRLVMAPIQVIDYVVIHELVHLHEKNHSRRFWDKVKTILPDYKIQVRWLKTYGHLLRLTD